jgi:drug/metabolite transporter superfamily protein YnfA
MFLPVILFSLFALLSTVGAYLIFARHRSRTAGIWAAAGTALFFAALFAGLVALIQSAGL